MDTTSSSPTQDNVDSTISGVEQDDKNDINSDVSQGEINSTIFNSNQNTTGSMISSSSQDTTYSANQDDTSLITLAMRGNSVEESEKRKISSFQDWQGTGYRVKAGDEIVVYVDVEENEPTPTLIYSPSMAQGSESIEFSLNPGRNEIVIPTIDYLRSSGAIQAGSLYFT